VAYRFNDYCIDLAGRDLRRGGDAVVLSPMVFDCIAYLIERRDRAVGRDELIAAIWGKTDVAYSLLGQLVAKARRALGGSGSDTHVIRTIPGFGYRWVAEVHLQDGSGAPAVPGVGSSDTDRAPPRHPPPGHRRVVMGGVGLAAALALALAATAYVRQAGHRGAEGPPAAAAVSMAEHRYAAVAVLPVEIDTLTDPDSTWIRFGLMDYIAGRLRQSALSVVPSTDIIYLTRNDVAGTDMIEKVRAATGVPDVVVPMATRAPDGWIVRLELNSGDNGRRVIQARAGDSVQAARDAADQLLVALGQQPLPPALQATPKTELLQRVEAALLAGSATDAKRLIDAAPAALRELAEVQLALARAEVAANQFDSARERLTSLRTSVLAETDPVLRARVLTALGRMDLDHPDAAPLFSEAIALLEDRNEPAYLGDAYNGRGIASLRNQRSDDAHADYARARIAYALARNTLRLAAVDNNEAELDLRNARPAEALPLFGRAAEALERFGAIDRLAAPLINQMSAHLLLLQPDAALAIYRQARPKLRGLEDIKTFHIFECQGALAMAASGRLTEAATLLDTVAAAIQSPHESDVLALVHKLQSGIAFAAGDTRRAAALAREAVDGLDGAFSSERAEAWLILTRALRDLDDATAAEETRTFMAWAAGAEDAGIAIRAQLAEADQAWSEDRRSVAASRYEDTLRLAHRHGTPLDIAVVLDAYGYALLESGDLIRASTVIGECGRWVAQDFTCAVLQTRLYRALGRRELWQATLDKARGLAGERPIPAVVLAPPGDTLAVSRLP